VRRLTLAFVSSLFLVAALASTALGWKAPVLVPDCAPDANSYAWTITLNPEDNQNIEFSWASNFSSPWTNDFGSSGAHDFTTARGGSTLYARYVSDHNAWTMAGASDELCEPPGEPSIDLDKFVWDEGGLVDQVTEGDPVTYTYEVTNDGEVNLDIVLLEDLIVSSPDTDPGDVACDDFERQLDDPGNDDAIFEPGETWVLTCTVDGLPVGVTENEACVYANVADEIKPDTVQDPHESDVSSCAEYEITVIEGGTQGGTGTPAASLPNSALSSQSPGTPIATLGFGLLLLSSLGALAAVNVRSTRR